MGYRIMLVEDEMIVAMDVRQRLESLAYEVVAHATSGADAVRYARETHPQLILMDIKIRGAMDGIEAATQIRAAQDIPVIYLTAFADEATLSRARVTEAFGYLMKPFEDRELHSAIEIALYKHKMDKRLRESEERYALAARAANDGIWDWNLITGEVYYSPRWGDLLGLPEEENIASTQAWLERVHPEDSERLNLALADHLHGVTPALNCDYRMRHQDGGYRWMRCRGLALFDDQKKPYRLAGSQSDITASKQMEEQLIQRALHDELTRLPNRALFMDRLRMVVENTRRPAAEWAAILFLDIDHFKVINDSLGHVSGDELLNAFAGRLKQCLRPGDTVARFGGDEFAILVDGIHKNEEASQIAERILAELRTPLWITGQEIFITTSIGIMFVTAGSQSIEDLLRDVDIAMYTAKRNGRARYEVFDPSMHEHSINRLQQEAEIRRALANAEFTLYYQPIYAVNSLELMGFEALLRWRHPARGLLLPAEFIQVAEETALIIPLGEWVLRTACAQAQAWRVATGKVLKMAVNLSAVQFNDRKLVQIIQAALSASGFDPQGLELELTETVAMQNLDRTLEILEILRQMGVTTSIDDFGRGYSSLDQIRHLRTNSLKIDRSFIEALQQDDSAIVAAIITMAHQLRLNVIAEGVETESQLAILAGIDCDQVQGFYLGKGVPPERAWELLAGGLGQPAVLGQ
jgi:diguanylate cyclase (GGDEF)-like protein/PAS domain S-box-containing protein